MPVPFSLIEARAIGPSGVDWGRRQMSTQPLGDHVGRGCSIEPAWYHVPP